MPAEARMWYLRAVSAWEDAERDEPGPGVTPQS